MITRPIIALLLACAAGPALAAELPADQRRHPDPACLDRNIDPETWKKKCVVDTGPPPPPQVRTNPDLPPPVFVDPEAPPPGPANKMRKLPPAQ